jgi:nucleoside-diphosphate-sugar epimerase
MRILVIGGSGFIGRYLVPELIARGHTVGVVVRPRSSASLPAAAERIRADRQRLGESAEELRAFHPDVVVDLILSSGRQGEELMRVFRGHAGRIVAITSMDVYRATSILHGLEEGEPQPVPLTEDSALRTRLQTYPLESIRMLQQVFGWLDDDYDKIPVERAVMADAELPATVLRLPMVYGPGDRLHRLFPLLKRMDDGRRTIVLPESLAQWRGSRGYVENVAWACALATASPHASGRIYNVADADTPTELEWARLVGRVAGWTGSIVVVPDEEAPDSVKLPGNLRQHWVPDTTRIRRELGYADPVPVEESIRRTIEWQREHPPPVESARFDYAAEDAAAQRVAGRQRAEGR